MRRGGACVPALMMHVLVCCSQRCLTHTTTSSLTSRDELGPLQLLSVLSLLQDIQLPLDDAVALDGEEVRGDQAEPYPLAQHRFDNQMKTRRNLAEAVWKLEQLIKNRMMKGGLMQHHHPYTTFALSEKVKKSNSLPLRTVAEQPHRYQIWLRSGDCSDTSGGSGKHHSFFCPSTDVSGKWHCLPHSAICDGTYDCPGHEDEKPTSCFFYKAIRKGVDQMAHQLMLLSKTSEP